VLVVDDSDVLRKIVGFNLSKEGFIVEEARDGVEALERMASAKPDLVILDIMMPRLNGFEVLKRMRTDPELSSIPVIVLTAKGGLAAIRCERPGRPMSNGLAHPMTGLSPWAK
jgi:two-component system chemotaxis response regulator CheY